MKKLFIVLVLIHLSFTFAQNIPPEKQLQQSVEMLNYISTLSERIKSSKSNRLELSEIRDEIYNNLIPLSIDEHTQQLITGTNGFLDTIEQFTLLDLQRERLEYIAEKEKSQALRNAFPNPILILSSTQADSPFKMAVSIVSAATSSYLNYKNSKDNSELKIFQQNAELNDKEYKIFESISKSCFNHMITISRDNHLTEKYTLSEQNIKDFVLIQNDKNSNKRLSRLTNNDNRSLYEGANYSPYYLYLIDTYYELNKYKECIEVFNCYQEKTSRIFRKDYELARRIPKVVYSAKEIYDKQQFKRFANSCMETLIKETSDKNWDLRYFAALTYIDLENFSKARDLLLDEIPYLTQIQEEYLRKYIAEIPDKIPENVIRKADIKAYKKLLEARKKARRTELVPLYEPFLLCCETFYSVNSKMPLNEADYKEKFLKVIENAMLNTQLRIHYGLEKENELYDLYFRESDLQTQKIRVAQIVGPLSFLYSYHINIPAVFLDNDTKISLQINQHGYPSHKIDNVSFEIVEIKRPNNYEDDEKSIANFISNDFIAVVKLDIKEKCNWIDFVKFYSSIDYKISASGYYLSFTKYNPRISEHWRTQPPIFPEDLLQQ